MRAAAGTGGVAAVTWALRAQVASRHVALVALLKMLPAWASSLLLRLRLLHRISPVLRLAGTSHSRGVAQLTANADLRALLAYLFYGQRGAVATGGRCRGRGGLRREQEGQAVIGAGGGCIVMGEGCTVRKGPYRDRRGHGKAGEGYVATEEVKRVISRWGSCTAIGEAV